MNCIINWEGYHRIHKTKKVIYFEPLSINLDCRSSGVIIPEEMDNPSKHVLNKSGRINPD
jgi:hypothetical protein